MRQPMNNDRLDLIYTQNVKQTKISCTKNLENPKDLLSTAKKKKKKKKNRGPAYNKHFLK